MSLTKRIGEAVAERGCATAEDLFPLFPEYARIKVFDAMGNARRAGLIHWEGPPEKTGKHRFSQPKHFPGPAPDHIPKKRYRPPVAAKPRPPASVWDLASEAQYGKWPPACETGRQFLKLSAFDEVEA